MLERKPNCGSAVKNNVKSYPQKQIRWTSYRSNSHTELAHGVERRRASVQNFLDEFRDGRTSSPVFRQFSNLFLGRYFPSNQKPEKAFGQRLRAAWCPGEKFLAFWDRLATETNTLICVHVSDCFKKHGPTGMRTCVQN
jgi:hypothetical protein